MSSSTVCISAYGPSQGGQDVSSTGTVASKYTYTSVWFAGASTLGWITTRESCATLCTSHDSTWINKPSAAIGYVALGYQGVLDVSAASTKRDTCVPSVRTAVSRSVVGDVIKSSTRLALAWAATASRAAWVRSEICAERDAAEITDGALALVMLIAARACISWIAYDVYTLASRIGALTHTLARV